MFYAKNFIPDPFFRVKSHMWFFSKGLYIYIYIQSDKKNRNTHSLHIYSWKYIWITQNKHPLIVIVDFRSRISKPSLSLMCTSKLGVFNGLT